MFAFDKSRLSDVFGADVHHDESRESATLTHRFGDEAFLEGHFPGFPVVPGVILLDGMILAALHNLDRRMAPDRGGIQSIRMESVAFYRPVLPGMETNFIARLKTSDEAEERVSARCSVMVAGTRHARASMTFLFHNRPNARNGINKGIDHDHSYT